MTDRGKAAFRLMPERIAPIDGLRGLAAVGVFAVHTVSNFTAIGHASFHGFSFGSVAWIGWIGVNLFFVLSGFVLYLPFADSREVVRSAFYRKRFLRLAPLYLIVAIVSALVWGHDAARDLLRILTVTFYVTPPYNVPGNDPLWSIAVEIYLSAFFPVFAMARRRMLAAAVIACVTAVALRVAYGLTLYDPANTGVASPWNFVLIVQSVSEFLIGMWCAQAYRAGLHMRLPRATFLLSIVGIVVVLGFADISNQAAPGLRGLNFLILDPLLGVLLLGALRANALTNRPLQLIGLMCFSVYVWHMPVLNIMANNAGLLGCCGQRLVDGWWWLYLLTFAVLLVVATASFLLIERPFMGWGRRLAHAS